MSALHARPGGDLRLLARGKLLNQHVARFTPPIRAQQNRNEWQLRLARYSAVFRQFAAARQWQWQDVRSSLCIGVGARSLACYGGSGPNGPSSGAGGSGGSGGDGWHAGPGHSSISNVLSDVAAVNDGSSDTAEQVILLDVGGMKCGGCVGHVKKLLEEHPAVLQATVNLATETALVRVTLTQGADLDKLAADLAQVLIKQGFSTTVRERRGRGWVSETALNHKRQQKLDKLHKTTQDLAVAWGLSLLCGLGHLAHLLPNAPAWMHALHHPALAATLSAAALLGPGRDIITAGWQALSAGRPDMNSLVGLGATASFAVSCVAAGMPALQWKTFFEEPAMLLGFVLVGRALEERAKLQASSDMAALQGLMPQTARLALGYTSAAGAAAAAAATQPGSSTSASGSSTAALGSTSAATTSSSTEWLEVPADAVGPGDVLLVLPGDRVPVDGAVLSGRSTVDESALTGEPLPLVKQTGSKVTAGTLNCDGSLLVAAEASGQDTVIADIVRLVESAQARTAPIQRLADTVAGKFAYGVMGLSAATFAFWSTVGAKAFPGVLAAASGAAAAGAACCCPPAAVAAAAGAGVMPAAAAVLLGLQLACNVMVVACPCALGLATPTAVLVGTAAGARKGLLVRGGDILEATSQVDTVVFDKTGTLTAGKPVVAGITVLTSAGSSSSSSSSAAQQDLGSSSSISPRLLLQLAAAVEQQATHPVGKALVAAAAADRAAVTAAGSSSDAQQQLQERRQSHSEASSSSSSSSSGRHKRPDHQHHHQSSSGGSDVFSGLEAAAGVGSSFAADQGTFLQEPGSGAAAVVAGHKVSVGTREWVERQGAALTAAGHQLLQMQQQGLLIQPRSGSIGPGDQRQQQQQQQQLVGTSNPAEPLTGHTQVFVGIDNQIVGLLDVADVIRFDARSTIQELHQQGIATVMLSGDRKEAAIKVAAAVGIPESNVYAGIKPAGKAALVEDLKRSGRRVAMVGDGINDTAALAAADVGMAMAGGVDAASDVSKVVLMGDQLHQVADAIELSKKTLRKIQQNLGWAFCYNIVGIPLAAGVLLPKYGIALTPSISGALMGVSSLAVMANSLLLQLEVRGMRNGLTSGGNAGKTLGSAQPLAAATVGANNSSRGRAGTMQQQRHQQLGRHGSSSDGGSAGAGTVAIDIAAATTISPAAAAGES